MDRDKLSAKEIELIKEWRAESEKNWIRLTTPDTVRLTYAKCADQLENLVGEVAEKSIEQEICGHCGGIIGEGEAGRCPLCGGP